MSKKCLKWKNVNVDAAESLLVEKKTMVHERTKDICPCCEQEKELIFVPWAIPPDPASGVSEPGIYVCRECDEEFDRLYGDLD
jgi:hypothetical protein